MLNFFSSQNELVSSRKAIRTSLEDALGSDNLNDCTLIIIHATIGHNFKELTDEAKLTCPNATVVGCSGGGVIGKDGPSEKMRSLAVMAICGPENEFVVGCHDSISGDNSFELGAKVAQMLKDESDNISMINVLASGIDIAADKVIEGIEDVFGTGIHIFGGTSADNMKLKTSFQFHNETILERGILMIGFADPTLKMQSAVSHGSRPIGNEFEVTNSESNEVIELNGKPAWEVLMNALDMPTETLAADAVVISALAEQIDPSLAEEYGRSHKLHTIFKVNQEKLSFYLPVDCPEGTKLSLVQRDEDLIFGGTKTMISNLTEKIDRDAIVAVFHTDCLARGRFTLDKIVKDDLISNLQNPIREGREIPWIGLYGFGEFTPLGGRNHFHTQTSSVYVLSRN